MSILIAILLSYLIYQLTHNHIMVVNKGRDKSDFSSRVNSEYKVELGAFKELTQRLDLFANDSAIAILKYIKDNQVKYEDLDEGITKQHVARHMDKEQILSRPSTLKLLDELLEHRIIIDAKKRNNARSRLMLNPELDYSEVVVNALSNAIQVTHENFEMFNDEAKGANTDLVNELLNTINNFKLKHKIEVVS
jgi:hypothetical protein